ncbi:hypothetical protein AMJ47_00575 [Parcubacteria bacterium DG_72]|nr:MAG: hypothetical protein AMJ47_00575 [Parcubacteria bacterium DG_72]
MSLVAGQLFFQGIVMTADSRVTLFKDNKIVALKDISQKLFYLPNNIIIGFAGDFNFANNILDFLYRQVQERPKLQNIFIFFEKGPKLIHYAYENLAARTGYSPKTNFLIGGIDFKRLTKVKNKDGTITILRNILRGKLFTFYCPEFIKREANYRNSMLAIGSGLSAKTNVEKSLGEGLQYGMRADSPLINQGSILSEALKSESKKLGIETVGGLFQVVTIDLGGTKFHTYKTRSEENKNPKELDLALVIRDNRYVQKNLKTGAEKPLLYPHEIIKIEDPSDEIFADLDNKCS